MPETPLAQTESAKIRGSLVAFSALGVASAAVIDVTVNILAARF